MSLRPTAPYRLLYNRALVIVVAAAALSVSGLGPAGRPAHADPPTTAASAWVIDGIEPEVFALARSGHGSLYVGGSFDYVGPYTGGGTVVTDQGGIHGWGVDGRVTAVVADGDGGWYVGGDFSSIRGQSRQNLAHILADGSVDLVWNAGANQPIEDLAVAGSTIYVAGNFTSIGGHARTRLAALDAAGTVTSWTPTLSPGGAVSDLAVAGSTIYLAGSFTAVAGQSRNNLAAVDAFGNATSWNPDVDGTVLSLAVVDDTVYAAGGFTAVGGEIRKRIAAIDADTGAPTAWNPDANGPVFSLAASGSIIYVGGSFTSVGGQSRGRLAAVDANGAVTSWNPNANGSVYTLDAAGSTVYAGGAFTAVAGVPRRYLGAIDSSGGLTGWNPSAGKRVEVIVASGARVAVGGLFKSVGGVVRRNVAEIDLSSGEATAWNPDSTGTPWGGDVHAILVSGETVYVGGSFLSIGGQARYHLAALDESGAATAWHPDTSGTVKTLAKSGSTIYAGGHFHTVAGAVRDGLVALGLDGTVKTWNPAGNGSVDALAADGSTVYAGGSFTTIGGKPRSYLAAIDESGAATGWNPSPSGSVLALLRSGSTIYVGGQFNSIGGAARNRLAAIDPSGAATAWNPNPNGSVRSLAMSGLHVYAGGDFTSVGGQTRGGLAAIDDSGASTGWTPSMSGSTTGLAAVGDTVYAGSSDARPFSAFVRTPAGLSLPALNGVPIVGQPATTSGGEWNHDAASLGYGWAIDGDLVPNAAGKTYTPTDDDIGRELRSRVTATNLAGSSHLESAAQIVEGPPMNDTLPTIDGLARIGATLTGDDGEWRAAPAADTVRQWSRCNEDGAECVDVPGATASSYVISQADLGKRLRFQVNKSNVHGSVTAVSTYGNVIAPPPPDGSPPEITLTGSLRDAEGESLPASGSYTLDVEATDGDEQDPQSGVKSIEVLVGEDSRLLETQSCPEGNCSLDASYVFTPASFSTGGHTIRVRVTDESGEEAEKSFIVIVHRPPVAPTLSDSESSSVTDATSFLYDGETPLQEGVDAGVIDPKRAAMLRGRVLARDGAPMPGVRVSIVEHPEFGSTTSRADGEIYLAVEGGAAVTVRYEKPAEDVEDGYLPTERTIDVPWQGYVPLEDVRMLHPDPAVTAVDLSGTAASVQAAVSGQTSDANGARRAVLLFAPSTSAEMEMASGAREPLGLAHVRATEYTVGSGGPEAMPGELPPASAYTYAVAYTLDEAEEAGALTVHFDKAVSSYTDNFLDFPVGSAVPNGTYDKLKGAWVPNESGRVVKILGETAAGLAEIDVDGDGQAATAGQLESLGFSDNERVELGELYDPGKELWRVRLTHFTDLDNNWAFQFPASASYPQVAPAPAGTDQPSCTGGSIIQCENQTLGEEVGLTGTPFALHYQSDRVPGWVAGNSVDVPLIGGSVPPGVERVELAVSVAGRSFEREFDPSPNLKHRFTWDGKDAFGRPVQGSQFATITVRYVYQTGYRNTPSFASTGGNTSIGESRAGTPGEAVMATTHSVTLGSWNALGVGLGGWSLDIHHMFDPMAQVLYRGDGLRRSGESVSSGIGTYAGGGHTFPSEGEQATTAELFVLQGLAVTADGDLWLSERTGRQLVRKVDTDGVITREAGVYNSGYGGFSGDGGPAKEAQLNHPWGLTADRDGSIYVADGSNARIRKIDPARKIRTVAGNGQDQFGGDGGPATSASLYQPRDVAVAPDGTLYIAEAGAPAGASRIRRVTPDGVIRTFAGTGQFHGSYGPFPMSGEGGLATDATLHHAHAVAVAPDGAVLVADTRGNRILRVTPDGIIRRIAGASSGEAGFAGDGGPAKAALLDYPVDVLAAPDGSVYVADAGNNRIRRITADGTISTIAGNGTVERRDGEQPTAGGVEGPRAIALSPDGSLYIAEGIRVRRVGKPLPGYSPGGYKIPSEDGSELYRFDESGRHLDTVNTATGTVAYDFEYDSAGRLASVTDADGNMTSVERDGTGAPMAVVGPYGHRTELSLNPDGWVDSISDPEGGTVALEYWAGGLLKKFTDPRGHASLLTYDELGRLVKDENPAGGFKSLSRTEGSGSFEVTMATKSGVTEKRKVEQLADGETRRTHTDPAGLETVRLIRADGGEETTAPDGTALETTAGADPRFGPQAPLAKSTSLTTPGDRTRTETATRTASLSTPGDPLSLSTLTETRTIGGNTYQSVFDKALRKLTLTSPTGRTSVTTSDVQGRPVSEDTPGLATVASAYDIRGRLVYVSQGGRETALTYNAAGNVASVTDPLDRTATYAYDGNGRVTSASLPGGREVLYEYDAAGNLTSLTPPGRAEHMFTHNLVDLLGSYTAPAVGQGPAPVTQYIYDDDRRVRHIDRPDGLRVTSNYDGAGRLATMTSASGGGTPVVELEHAYSAETGQLIELDTGVSSIAFTQDGPLPIEEELVGPIDGAVGHGYDSQLRPSEETVNEGHSVSFGYDGDGLLTQAGALAIDRDPVVGGTEQKNGLVAATTLGDVTTAFTYNSFGEPVAESASHSGQSVFTSSYTRDDGGRITARTQTTSDGVVSDAYVYETAGRLTDATRTEGGETIATHYIYDANGNRTERTRGSQTTYYSYDAQDRLTDAGTLDLSYDENGQLTRRQDSADASDDTTYRYDAFGQLEGVTLPDESEIAYIIDGLGNRVGKKVDGQVVQGFLYGTGTSPVAELDAGGSVVSRFVYGTRSTTPDYMVRGGMTYRILTDQLGSPRLVVNASTGAVAQKLDYDEFGVVTADTSPGFQPFGFGGGLYDRDTKLTHFGAREYMAEIGRWASKDPIRFEGGDTNLYGYVFSDPVNLTDPSGLIGVPSFNDLTHAMAGWGDEYTFGVTNWARGQLGFNDGLDKCSGWYQAGGIGGLVTPSPWKALNTIRGVKGATRLGVQGERRRLPSRGRANSSDAIDDGRGRGQIRDYGSDGRAKTDFDFGHDHGFGDPHAHDWDWSRQSPRGPGRPIRNGERPPGAGD